MTLTVVDPVQGSWMDALLDADGESTIPQVADQLGRMLGTTGPNPGSPPLLFVDGNLIDQRHTLASSPLREGSVVSLHNPSGCLPAEPYGTVEVRVAGGPDAGGVHRINPGYADIGRSRRNRVKIDDPGIPDFALRVSLDVHGMIRVAPYEGVTATLEKQPLVGEAEWKPGMQLVIGTSIIEVGYYTPPDAALTPSDDGAFLDYNRPPRILPPERQTKFRLPQPVSDEHKRPFPIIMLIAPLLMAVAMAVMMHQPRYLMMAAMSPMMMLGNYWQDKKAGSNTRAQQIADYEAKKARIEQDARDALALERAHRRQECPDPATLLDIGIGPRQRLWERRRRDADHLLLRVGTLDQESEVVLDDPEQDEHRRAVAWTVPEAPVKISLRERGVIGIAGPSGTPRALARWLVAQTAALSSPDDVQFVLLTDSHAQQDWEWMRWLPHMRP
ncbi:MAG: cell division protein FtsK, partial [Catenulispora sp.]|nr:cell division protein FtsK [Catenulispora sp.]